MSGSLAFPGPQIASAGLACAAGLQAVAEAVRTACADPADAIRLLSALAAFEPASVPGEDAISQDMQVAESATAAACRQAALLSLARACAEYQPVTYEAAQATRTAVAALLDTEATAAADAGDSDTYHALWTLRSAVIADLTARGAALSTVTTVRTKASLPAAVLAQRLYRDPTRADELITWANPWHPLFMPTRFQALAR